MHVESAADCLGDAATADNVQQAMSHVRQAGNYLAAAFRDAAGDTMNQLEAKADQWAESTGSKIKEMGANLASDPASAGVLDTVSNAVAESMVQGGDYLQNAKVSGTKDDLAKLIRRHPIASLAIAAGIGWLVGRSTRK